MEHLYLLKIPEGMKFEIILIDNASTDSTFQLMQEIAEQIGKLFQIIILKEPKPGLSNARMLGMNLANYEYILLCDDDNWLYRDYLIEAAAILEADPLIGMLGGCGIYEPESSIPGWSKNINIFALGPQGQSETAVEVLYGAGVILRREIFLLLKSVEFEFLLSDRIQDSLSSGGDYELCIVVKIAGYRLWYSDKLRFEHHFDKQRFEVDYFKKFTKESSSALDILSIYHFILLYPDKGYKSFLQFFGKQILFELKEFIICKLKYSYRSKNNEYRSVYYFRYLYHQYRIYYMKNFLISAKGYFKKVKKIQLRLNSKKIPLSSDSTHQKSTFH